MANEPLITVAGNLVADPELRVSQAGKPWVTFRIASTPRVKDRQTNDWSDGEPLWLGCRAYGQEAENIAASLRKGNRVLVLGRLTQRSYTDNQGQQRTSLDLEVEECGPSLKFATAQPMRGGAGGAAGAGSAASHYGQPQTAAAAYGQQPAQQAPAYGQPAQPQGQAAWNPAPSAPAAQAPQQPAAQQPAQGDPWNNQPGPATDNPWGQVI